MLSFRKATSLIRISHPQNEYAGFRWKAFWLMNDLEHISATRPTGDAVAFLVSVPPPPPPLPCMMLAGAGRGVHSVCSIA